MIESGIQKLVEGHDQLLVVFGGINQGMGIPVFEFQRVIQKEETDKIFIRDFQQSWYHLGIDTDIRTFDELEAFLTAELKRFPYKKVTFMGNSMGGYAALLFGTRLRVDRIIAFSPQVFIDPIAKMRALDFRWIKQLSRLYLKGINKKFWNLKEYFNSELEDLTSAQIHYTENHRLDRLQATSLQNTAVKLFPYSGKGHNLVKELRDSGELLQIIRT